MGQIGIDPDVWPLIQLYIIHPGQNAIVNYNNGGPIQSVHLHFDEADNLAGSSFDRPTYPKNAPVYLRVTDIQLNIDPTDKDSWTFGTNPAAPTTFYQIFDENGQPDADGTLGAVDISNKLQDFFFEDAGLLLIDTDYQNT